MRIVYTSLKKDEFKEFEIICKKEGISKSEALRNAIFNWILEKKGLDPDDPLFIMPPGSAIVKNGAGNVDNVVYRTRK